MNTQNPGAEDTHPQKNTSSLTQVKTIYARAAIILLAINFAFTGYLTYNMNQIQTELVESLQGQVRPQTVKLSTKASPQSAIQPREESKSPSPLNDQ